jgi:hypothetical protein
MLITVPSIFHLTIDNIAVPFSHIHSLSFATFRRDKGSKASPVVLHIAASKDSPKVPGEASSGRSAHVAVGSRSKYHH